MPSSHFGEEDVWLNQMIADGKEQNYNCPLCIKFKGGTKWKLTRHLTLSHIKQ